MAPDYDDLGPPADARAPSWLLGSVRRLVPADELLRHGGVLAGATVVSGGLNYAFQVFMGRALGPERYGIFGAVFSLFYLVKVLGSGIQFSATRFTAEYDPADGTLPALHGGLVLRAFLVGLAISALLVVASPIASEFLGLSSVWPVVFVAVTVLFWFAFMVNMGSLQGLQWFGLLGSYNVLHAGTKLATGVILVLLGFGLHGAFSALVLAVAIALVATTLHLRTRLVAPTPEFRDASFDYGDVYGFMSPAVLAGFCLMVPSNVDVILVKHFFPGEQAGLYVAAAVLGKVLIFLPMGISKALFPKVSGEGGEGGSARTQALLDRALLYAAIVAGSGTLTFWLAPSLVLETFFGADYVAAAPLVQWYGVAVLAFVLSIVVLNFELARDRMRFVYVFTAVTAVEIGLMWTFHGSMVRIVQVILVVNAGLCAYGVVEAKR